MKKLISIVAALLLGTIILTSCGAKTPDETTDPTTTEAFVTTTEAPTKPTEETTEAPEDYQAITEKSTARSTTTTKTTQRQTTTTKPTTKTTTTTAPPPMGGGIPVHLPYRMEYGVVPDAVVFYAKEKNDPTAVQAYMNAMFASYSARYAKGDTSIDNELYLFMKKFNIPEEAASSRLGGTYTDAEFKIICANDQKAINRAFYNSGYCYFSELDGKIYPLHEICSMTTEEIRQKQIPDEAILKLIDNHPNGVIDYNTGKVILAKADVDALRGRIG